MSKQKRKRNHWVPQGYLRSFAADRDRRKIWTFSSEAGEPRLKPIRNVAVGFYLYAPRGPQGRDYEFEERLASLEQWFGHPDWADISTGYVDLCSKGVRKGVSLLAAVMFLRNPQHLTMTAEMHRQFVEMFSEFPELPDEIEINGQAHEVDKESWPAYRDASEDDIKRMWIKQVGSAAWLAEILMKMRWAVLISEEPRFITSDNPVVLLHPSLGFKGFKNPETAVVFPLSPTRVLFLDNRHSEPDGQYYPFAESVAGLNGLLWRYSIEHMFSSRHPDQVCSEMCENAERMGFVWRPGGWVPPDQATGTGTGARK